jgi:ABC-2 type transport system permease protein
VSVVWLLGPKLRTQQRRLAESASTARLLVLGGAGALFWLMLFAIVARLLRYFRAAPGVGDLLAVKLLGLILLSFLAILLLSNVITALSSFFLARDLELLAAAPVDGVRLYAARLIETTLNSSWMMVLVLVPILSAYGVAYHGGATFLLVCCAALACFLVLPAVVGTAVTQVLVNIFPARRARDLLALIALFGAAAVIMLFRLLRPEQLARPEGFRDLVDFIGTLRTPQSPWLPSEWASEAMLAPLSVGGVAGDWFPLLLLASTAAAFLVLGSWVHARLYHEGLSRSQEGAELQQGAGSRQRARLERWLAGAPVRVRSLVAKDIRTFFRDTTQWSQLVLLAVLVVVYTYNIKVLPLYQGEAVGALLVSIISFLNLGLAGFVLAAISARFLFPAVSLEGRTLWLLRASPLPLRSLLWSKYWVGVVPLLLVAVALTLATNLILRVQGLMLWTSLVTIVMITFAVASMALGLGALFPKFDTDNAAEIPTGFGGLLFMMTAISYLAAVVTLEAWPVLALQQARAAGVDGTGHVAFLVACYGAAAVLSLAAVVWPLRAAARRIEALDQ